MIITLFHTT